MTETVPTWQLLGQQAAAVAPRFLLRPGELLSVDNYRVFHGREPYQGSERIPAFTDMSYGKPSGGRNVGPAGGRRPGSNSATVQP
jgi:hypothetical protein